YRIRHEVANPGGIAVFLHVSFAPVLDHVCEYAEVRVYEKKILILQVPRRSIFNVPDVALAVGDRNPLDFGKEIRLDLRSESPIALQKRGVHAAYRPPLGGTSVADTAACAVAGRARPLLATSCRKRLVDPQLAIL